MKQINIEKIMEEIREEIKEKKYPELPIEFKDLKYDEITEEMLELDKQKFNSEIFKFCIIYLNKNKEVKAWRYLSSNSFFGKIKVIIKKIMRKLTKSYVEPIVIDQNKLNEKIYYAFCQINAKHEEDKERILELETRVSQLEDMLKGSKK